MCFILSSSFVRDNRYRATADSRDSTCIYTTPISHSSHPPPGGNPPFHRTAPTPFALRRNSGGGRLPLGLHVCHGPERPATLPVQEEEEVVVPPQGAAVRYRQERDAQFARAGVEPVLGELRWVSVVSGCEMVCFVSVVWGSDWVCGEQAWFWVLVCVGYAGRYIYIETQRTAENGPRRRWRRRWCTRPK